MLVRVGVGVTVAALFAIAMAGILLTGPVVVRTARLEVRADASPERLRRSVEHLCGPLAPRTSADPDALAEAADWIASELAAAGVEVTLAPYAVRGRSFFNVVARVPGDDAGHAVTVIGAHYDAVASSPGADDNASGVAVLIELARTLPPEPRRSRLYLVAFGTEEVPFDEPEEGGGAAFARRLVERGERVELMVALDGVGYFSDQPGSQRLPYRTLRVAYPGRGSFIAVVGDLRSGTSIGRVKRRLLATSRLPVYSFRIAPGWIRQEPSADRAFRARGLPAVRVTDTGPWRNPHHHGPGDTPDKLDYERMARLVEALHGVILENDRDE